MNSQRLISCACITNSCSGSRFAGNTLKPLLLTEFVTTGARPFSSRPEQEHSIVFHAESRHYKKCCAVLQVPPNADQEQVRQAYLELAKKYHPDGGFTDASKFHEIDEAYKYLQKAFADLRHNRHKVEGEFGLYYKEKPKAAPPAPEFEEEEATRIKHVTPQHRQYLSYDGVGIGNPFQRERGYQKHRAAKAAENLYEHRIEKLTQSEGTEETALTKNRKGAKKGATRYGLDRLVEDLIQESMAKGDFEGLSGAGKPLQHTAHANPHVDFTTHKLNQVLIENGFTPEWILLEKEIRTEIRDIRHMLKTERHKYDKEITDPADKAKWNTFLADRSLRLRIEDLNSRIGKYNLVVPILFKQIVSMNLEREARIAEKEWSVDTRVKVQQAVQASVERQREVANKSSHSRMQSDNATFLGFLFTLFSSK